MRSDKNIVPYDNGIEDVNIRIGFSKLPNATIMRDKVHPMCDHAFVSYLHQIGL